MNNEVWKETLVSEIEYKTFRSGGKGGQNVNKVETAVQLSWPIITSSVFPEKQKILLQEKLSDRMNKEGVVLIKSQRHRTQLMNKQDATEKLFSLIEKALTKKKIRIATKIPKGVIEKRLLDKKRNSERKANRKSSWE